MMKSITPSLARILVMTGLTLRAKITLPYSVPRDGGPSSGRKRVAAGCDAIDDNKEQIKTTPFARGLGKPANLAALWIVIAAHSLSTHALRSPPGSAPVLRLRPLKFPVQCPSPSPSSARLTSDG